MSIHIQKGDRLQPAYEVAKVGDVLSLEYGIGLPESKREPGIYPVYGSNGIVGYHKRPIVKGPGIIVGRKGSIGKVNWSESDFWPIDTTYYVVLKKESASLKWLYYLLPQLKLKDLNAATGIPGLNRNDAYALKCFLPSVKEQTKIISMLSEIDELIQKTDQIIEQTQRLKKGLMQKLLTEGIEHKSFQQTTTGKIPVEWKISKIGSECKVGTGGTPSRRNPEYFKGGIPWVKSTEINYNVITSTEEHITEKALEDSSSKYYEKGILLMAIYGEGVTRGRCAILGINAAINQACAAIQSMGNVLNKFIFYWCQWRYNFLRSRSHGTHQSNFNLEFVRLIEIPLPPLEEQARIVEILTNIDDLKKAQVKYRQKVSSLKKGLMQNLLTGKIRVKI